MAGFQLPNIGNALVRGMQFRAFNQEQEDRQRRRDLAPDVQAAIGGDSGALGRVAAVDPDYALRIGPVIDRLDANKQAVVKRAADFTIQAGMGLSNTPPELRPQVYQEARAEAQRRGIPTDSWPSEWGPRAEGFMTFNIGKARDVNRYLDEKAKTERETAGQPVPMPGYGGAPAGGPAPNNDRYQTAIGGIESAGQPNGGYGAVGPDTGRGRAYGKYQVMDFNVGPWTQEVLGRAMTPQEFAASPQAQDAVFNAKFGQYRQKYGDEGAAKAWFAGEGGMSNPDAADVNGMTVARYADRFNRGLPPQGPQVAQAGGPPVIPQGGGEGPMPVQPQQMGQPDPRNLRSLLPEGVVPLMNPKTRMPVYDQSGRLAVQLPDGSRDFVEVPKAKVPGQTAGPFAGSSVEAQALNMLIGNGTLSPQQAAELAAGKTITNPADGMMMFMTPSGIFRQPAQQPGPAAGTSQTVTPTPPADQPNPGMIPLTAPKPVKMTDEQAKAAGFADRMTESEKAIEKFGDAALDFGSRQLEGVPLVGNYLQTPEYRQFEQARRDFINSQLRRESGAVISDQEFANAEKQYFPRPGDDPATIAQKAKNRALAIQGMKRSAGPSYGQPQGGGQPKVNGPAEEGRTLFEARDAIKRGASPDAVKKRLQEMGVDPGKL